MNPSQDQSKAPQPKPVVKEQPQDQLTEEGPSPIPGRKLSPFRRLLNALWGPIRG